MYQHREVSDSTDLTFTDEFNKEPRKKTCVLNNNGDMLKTSWWCDGFKSSHNDNNVWGIW